MRERTPTAHRLQVRQNLLALPLPGSVRLGEDSFVSFPATGGQPLVFCPHEKPSLDG